MAEGAAQVISFVNPIYNANLNSRLEPDGRGLFRALSVALALCTHLSAHHFGCQE